MNKDTVPDNFSMGMVLMDALPVVFFGVGTIMIGIRTYMVLFLIGAAMCLAGGLIKVLWKAIVVIRKRNIWPMFVQMRISMPLGFVLMLASLVAYREQIDYGKLWMLIIGLPQVILFGICAIMMLVMIVCAIRLDSSKARSNWIEQAVNTVAQLSFMLGVILL